ncbi:unnamed protein product [Caenorhabditis bovis]|uniref:CCAAT-binding factor domain-containing protein n=1 Tax=Caenorhabditis bovis TaxID=2654633 RepID=A0A8S1EN37_9PELO|nr:unnamed protein product [Caenorhabditis bovis]
MVEEDEFDQYFENAMDASFEGGNYEDDESEDDDQDNVNTEYELTKEEPVSKNPKEFAKFLHKTEFPEDITGYFKSIKLFERNPKNGTIIPTKSLGFAVNGFSIYLFGKKRIRKAVLKGISQIFGCYDIFHYISSHLVKHIVTLRESHAAAWSNLFNFMSFIKHPNDGVSAPFFKKFCKQTPFTNQQTKKRRLIWISNDWEKVWSAILHAEVNSKIALKLIPYVTENILSKLKEPFKTADFFFKMFDKKDIHAILSLGAIFKLITEHNFEYPKFYNKVYSLIKPSMFYMENKDKVLVLLDSFLSSTHLPIYIVASFIKRLARCLTLAPVDAQEPTLGLIRNLIIRHPNCYELVHRELPKTLSEDPFDDNENELSKTKALESSLWELKLLQHHWNQSVRKRAHFIDKPKQSIESYVRFRCIDELFSTHMAKTFGGEETDAEKYQKLQDGDDEEEVKPEEIPTKRKKKFGGKFAARHEEKTVKPVNVNQDPPSGIMNRKISNIDVPLLWKI